MAENGDAGVESATPGPWYALGIKLCRISRNWRTGSRGANLVAFWVYCLCLATYNPALNQYPVIQDIPDIVKSVYVVLIVCVIVSGPLAGLAASVHFQRFKLMSASLWLLWTGIILSIPIYILQIFYPGNKWMLYDFGVITAQVLTFIGFLLFIINSISFGLDQMPDASQTQISAFLYWCLWAVIGGQATNQIWNTTINCKHADNTSTRCLMSFLSALVMSVPVCTITLLRHWFIIEPNSKNPLKTIYRVLKFAAKHKYPVRRSAFTYCDDRRPSRLDLAKTKFGGPFTNEEVEDVKTFFRMILVICTTSIVVFATTMLFSALGYFLRSQFTYTYPPYQCNDHIVQLVVLLTLCTVSFLPIYNGALAIPSRFFFFTTLKRVGCVHIMIVCASIFMLILTTVWYIQKSPSVCMFVSRTLPKYSTDNRWIEIPAKVFLFYTLFCFLMSMLEFVCAQSPYSLRGPIIGTLFSVIFLTATIGIVAPQFKTLYTTNIGSCGIWYYVFTTVTAVFGLIVFCIVAKWYRNREREPPDMYRVFVEAYYDRYCGR